MSHLGNPTDLNSQSVTAAAIDNGAIYTSAITNGTISSRTLGLSSYVPNGEGVQRIPAPLHDVEYWEDVIQGLIELHKSGVHDVPLEDTKNVSVSTEGILFSPLNGVAGGEARLYLTGRMPVPKSRKIYATWNNTATIGLKAVYWDSVTPLAVSKVGISDGVVTVTTTTDHGLSIGSPVKITSCGVDYDGIYIVDDTPSATTFTYAASSTSAQNINENFLAIEGRAALEVFNYEYLENKISITFPDTAGEYAIYAELGSESSPRTLTEAKVFEVIGSGQTPIISANVNNKVIVSNVATLTTESDHSFKVDDIVNISGIADSASVTTYSGSSNVLTLYTSGNHYFLPGYSVTLANISAPTAIDGTYTILSTNTATSFAVSLPISNVSNTSVSTTATVSDGVFNGQAKITATTSNTFSYSRTFTGGVPSTAVSPVGLAEVGKPRYAYAQYIVAAKSGSNSNVTIYTESNHGFAVGETVTLSGFSDITLFTDTARLLDNSFVVATTTDKSLSITISNSAYTLSYQAIPTTARKPLVYAGNSETSVEMGPDGLRYISAGSGSVDTDLGTTADGYLGITRVDGQSVASIDATGGGTFSSLATDEDVLVSGTNLVGTFASASYNGSTYDGDILNRLARGSIYKATFSLGSSSNTTYNVAVNTVVTTLGYGKFTVEDGRDYLVSVSPGGLRTNTNVTSAFEFVLSTAPMRADSLAPTHLATSIITTTAAGGEYAPLVATYSASVDPQMGNTSYTANITAISRATNTVTVTANSHGLVAGDYVSIANTTSSNVPNTAYLGTFPVATVPNINAFTYVTTDSGTIANAAGGASTKVSSYLYTPGLLPSNVDIYWLARIKASTSTAAAYTISLPSYQPAGTPQMEVVVLDMGQAKASTVAAKLGFSSGLLDVSVSYNAGTTNTRTLVSATQAVYASESAYYDNYGRGSGTTDPYAYKYSLYQGNPGTSSGTKKSAVLFPTFTLPSGAANVVVSKVEVYLKNSHSYWNSGLTAYIGVHSNSSLGTSIPGITNYGVVTASFSKGGAKWVTLPSASYTAFKPGSQSARGIILGATDDNPDTFYSGIDNYGYFDGNSMSNEPQLRVTYTYDI
jgi:hypothetical protein